MHPSIGLTTLTHNHSFQSSVSLFLRRATNSYVGLSQLNDKLTPKALSNKQNALVVVVVAFLLWLYLLICFVFFLLLLWLTWPTVQLQYILFCFFKQHHWQTSGSSQPLRIRNDYYRSILQQHSPRKKSMAEGALMPISPPAAASTEQNACTSPPQQLFNNLNKRPRLSTPRHCFHSSTPISLRFCLTQQTYYTCRCYRSWPILLLVHNAESPVLGGRKTRETTNRRRCRLV